MSGVVLRLTESEVAGLLTPALALEAVRDAFRCVGRGWGDMPPKAYVRNEWGDFRSMPALISAAGRPAAAGVKWVSVFPRNASAGLPTVQATYLLSSAENGALEAILDASVLTAYRTGAAGAIASEYLFGKYEAQKGPVRIALIGSGRQAEYQALCHREIYREWAQFIVWSHDSAGLARFCAQMTARLSCPVIAAPDLDTAVGEADILCTCTTAVEPVLFRGPIRKKRVHINAIGADAPGKQEIDFEILKDAVIVVDDIEQASHSGEINMPLTRRQLKKDEITATLGELLVGNAAACARLIERQRRRTDAAGSVISVFDSTGLAAQDLFTAVAVVGRYKVTLPKSGS